MTVLSTARLTLTPVAVGDMDDLTALWADAEFTRHIMGRGLSEEEASAMIVRGFIEPIAKLLPLEYAVELNRLIELEMEGSVG